MTNLYENMIDAIAAYYKQQETDIEREMSSDERVDVDHINAQCILDWLQADTDAMNAVAEQVKAHVLNLRATQGMTASAGHKYQQAALLLGEAFRENWKAMVVSGQFTGSLKEYASQELEGNFGEELWPELY
jgi:hypothetical protein